jgi:hypothetical protein
MSTRQTIDVSQRDDAPYWGAVLVMAIRSGDAARAAQARRQLCRLGIDLAATPTQQAGRAAARKAVRHG